MDADAWPKERMDLLSGLIEWWGISCRFVLQVVRYMLGGVATGRKTTVRMSPSWFLS